MGLESSCTGEESPARNLEKSVPIIGISASDPADIRTEAFRKLCNDFLEKPIKAERLLVTLDNAIKNSRLINEREKLITELKDKYSFIGQSKTAKRLFETIDKIVNLKAGNDEWPLNDVFMKIEVID